VKHSLPASRTTLDKLGPSLTRMIRISTVICYAFNGELASIFKRWYPDLDMKVGELPIAARPPSISMLSS